jgi:outer membrane lipoprotein carrier protein
MRLLALALVPFVAAACGDSSAPTGTTASAAGASTVRSASAAPASPSSAPAVSGAPSAAPSPSGSGDAPPALSGSAAASAAPTAKPTAAPSATPSTTASAAPTATPTAEPTASALPAPPEGSADAIAQGIDDVFKGSKRYRSRFVQKYTIKVQNKTKEQKGTVLIERPNKISFHYDPPNENRVVSDGTTIQIYTAEDKQVVVMPVKNTEYPGAFGFIMGQGLRSSFSFEFNDKTKYEFGPVLLGTPTTPNPQYEKVMFYVDKAKLSAKDAGAVAAVLILDAQGNRNRFEFFEPSFPATVDASEFKFTPPPGTSVLKK